jgi:hypothetical protein
MNLPFHCPYCDELLEIAPALAGKTLLCPRCEGHVAAPSPSARTPVRPHPTDCLQLSYRLATWGTLGYLFLLLLLFALGLYIGYYT